MIYYIGINKYGQMEMLGYCSEDKFEKVKNVFGIGEFGLFIKELSKTQYDKFIKSKNDKDKINKLIKSLSEVI